MQDSLGGNSRTLMIACISSTEVNFEETLNTLKYASRARNIRNAPVKNRDKEVEHVARMKQMEQEIYILQEELGKYKNDPKIIEANDNKLFINEANDKLLSQLQLNYGIFI